MIPKITRGGRSFKGAFRYYLHDKGADTCHRVAWVQMENMRARDPASAWKVMTYTAKAQERLKEASGQARTGRKLERPVFAFSLAWHPEQSPDQAHMLDTARQAIAMLGLSEHEAVIVAHKDEPQKHVHVILNRVHPITGLAGDVRNSKRKFSDFAREYERQHGKIYCAQREENHEKRETGKPARYVDQHIVEAWQTTRCGQSFMEALEARGYRLAQGRKRLVIVDPHGKAHNPTRHLQGVRAKDIHARLSNVDLTRLPDAQSFAARKPAFSEERERQRAAREMLTKARLVHMDERHRLEYERLVQQHERRIRTAKVKLAAYYDLPARKKELLGLKKIIANAPWWKRLFGITRKDKSTFSEKAKTYNDALGRYRESIAGIKKEALDALAELKNRQSIEEQELTSYIAMQRGKEGMNKRDDALRQKTAIRLSEVFAEAQRDGRQKKSKNRANGRMERPSPSYAGRTRPTP